MTTQSKTKKFRSKFEKGVFEHAKKHKHQLEYEPPTPVIRYVTPAVYVPDFRINGNIYVECKGYFSPRDRKKMRLVKRDNPTLDIRFVFQRANNQLTKSPNSMMYWQWAERHGFIWADKNIPEEWYEE